MIDRIRRFLFGPSPADIAEASSMIARVSAECRRQSDLEDAIFDEWLDKYGNQHSEYRKALMITCGPEINIEVITEAGNDHFKNYFRQRLEELNAK